MDSGADITFTDDEIRMIRRSFARLISVSDRVSAEFYNLLFERHPDIRPLFSADMSEQREKFVLMLANLVDTVDDPGAFSGKTNLMGVRHIGYGATSDHYEAVGDALLTTLQRSEVLDLTIEETDVWQRLYAAIASGMIEGSI